MKYQSGDCWLIEYQIPQINIITIIWQTVRRITNEILRVQGLRGKCRGMFIRAIHFFLARNKGGGGLVCIYAERSFDNIVVMTFIS